MPPCRLFTGSFVAVLTLLVLASCGCSKSDYAPVSGKVTYKGKPLTFGSVMFQPEDGQPASGFIQPDGTFVLSTNSEGDGARIGTNQVRVACYAAQKPQADGSIAEEPALGPSLIPTRYTSFSMSGIVIEVPPEGLEGQLIELKD